MPSSVLPSVEVEENMSPIDDKSSNPASSAAQDEDVPQIASDLKRGRGRPRRGRESLSSLQFSTETGIDGFSTPKPKKGRGRPPKNSAGRPGRPRKAAADQSSTSSPTGKKVKKDPSSLAKKPNKRVKTAKSDGEDATSENAGARVITKELEDCMLEVFINNTLQTRGGLLIPHELAVEMHRFFAPALPKPEPSPMGEVFVSQQMADRIREIISAWQ